MLYLRKSAFVNGIWSMWNRELRKEDIMFKILVVEDDKALNRSVCAYLDKNGFEAVGCVNAADAYDAMYENTFDMIISDIMMPEIDGFEFAENVRKLDNDIPIMFMTAREDMSAKQKGFKAGIDDYMVKPIDMEEMLLRVGALLRRAKIAATKKLTIGSLVLDAEEHTAYVADEEINLTVR